MKLRLLKFCVLVCVVALFIAPVALSRAAAYQPAQDAPAAPAPDAPAGLDGLTNGFTDQATFDQDKAAFLAQETPADGIGPVFNSTSCGECHSNPAVGGGSQILEIRAGFRDSLGNFVDPPGGSLINDRALDPSIQETVPENADFTTSRLSLSLLGDGFIEAVPDSTIIQIARNQSAATGGAIAGQVIRVPVLEAPGVTRVARFGWKNQHASLLSFSGDAYVNEMGITTPLFPLENTSLGRSVRAFDQVNPDSPDEPDNDDIEAFTRFIRSTKTPPRDTALAQTVVARRGETLFNQIGCALCHTPSMVTAPPGTSLNGGMFIVDAALGNKTIRPYSDLLLHNIGTGDGIVQEGGPSTQFKVRTPPLWGVRTRTRLMHDGRSGTLANAISRHAGEASTVANRFSALSQSDRNAIITFLKSL
jgi:predicted outer membrane repeat protein